MDWPTELYEVPDAPPAKRLPPASEVPRAPGEGRAVAVVNRPPGMNWFYWPGPRHDGRVYADTADEGARLAASILTVLIPLLVLTVVLIFRYGS